LTNLTLFPRRISSPKLHGKQFHEKISKKKKQFHEKSRRRRKKIPQNFKIGKKSVTSIDFLPLRFFWYWLEKKPTLSMDKSTFLRINKSQESISDYFSKTSKKNIFFNVYFPLVDNTHRNQTKMTS
jgi:hypothetical protein